MGSLMNNSREEEYPRSCNDEKYIIASFINLCLSAIWTNFKIPLPYLRELGISGTILLADEGINGTIAGTRNSIKDLYQWFCDQPNLNGLQINIVKILPFLFID